MSLNQSSSTFCPASSRGSRMFACASRVEALENEADPIASKLCQLAVFKRRDISIFNEYGS